MDWIQSLVLAVVQGLTEFLPISSSAHLILLPRLFGWPDQGLAFDVAVHVGSLVAVLVYFRHPLRELSCAWWRDVRGGPGSQASRLAWALMIATLPVVVVGSVFVDWIESNLRHPLIIATATLLFALLLWAADRSGRHERSEHQLLWRDALLVGCAQALALIPGTSRAGITITAGLWLGLTREASARFSFLLAIPVILLAGARKTWDLIHAALPAPWLLVLLGAVVSGITAFLCIHWFLKLVERVGLAPFVLYRIAVALALFALYW